MKILMINGSPDEKGCIAAAFTVISGVLHAESFETEIIQTGKGPVRDCIGCGCCDKLDGQCAFADDVANEILRKARTADGFVFGTPVYYAHPSGRILSLLDRVFRAGGSLFAHKPAFAVASARRAGTIASIDVLNKYFTIDQMPVVSATYWTEIHGSAAADIMKDAEGILTLEHAARNLSWLVKCIDAGKKAGIAVPVNEKNVRTNFIR
jgi:multimeric flavodoxin WrbA